MKTGKKTVSINIVNWLKEALKEAGLELKESKTRIVHDDSPVNFLGYEIQKGKGVRMDSQKVKRLRVKVKSCLKGGKSSKRVIKELNPILRGFYNYAAKFSSGKMWKQMGKIDWDISQRCYKLYKIGDIGQVRYTDVPKTVKYMVPPKGATWLHNKDYWNKRDLTNLPARKRTRYKTQTGVCPLCKRRMNTDDVLETHHIKLKGKGGKDKNSNVILVHMTCHNEHHGIESMKEANLMT